MQSFSYADSNCIFFLKQDTILKSDTRKGGTRRSKENKTAHGKGLWLTCISSSERLGEMVPRKRSNQVPPSEDDGDTSVDWVESSC